MSGGGDGVRRSGLQGLGLAGFCDCVCVCDDGVEFYFYDGPFIQLGEKKIITHLRSDDGF